MILKIRLCKSNSERDLEYSPYYYFESKSDNIKTVLAEFIKYKDEILDIADYSEICDYSEINIMGRDNYKYL